jgi:dimeric dUTPase (all-alpha-NTP-PPase superfamily)
MELQKLFDMQESLNDFTFEKKGITGVDGKILTMKTIMASANEETVGPNTDANHWLRNYLEAGNDESRELGEELLWKWWSKDTLNMQNVRVEIIDQLHFWMSTAMAAGMNASDVERIYVQKNQVNLDRQNNGYNKADKNEDDNEGIK